MSLQRDYKLLCANGILVFCFLAIVSISVYEAWNLYFCTAAHNPGAFVENDPKLSPLAEIREAARLKEEAAALADCQKAASKLSASEVYVRSVCTVPNTPMYTVEPSALFSDRSYMIAKFRDTVYMERWVTTRLHEGWRPLGGVSVYQDNYRPMFCQAMQKGKP